MRRPSLAGLWFFLFLAIPVNLSAADAAKKPLQEADLNKLIELQIDDVTISSKVNANGLNVDNAALERLKKVGASDVVIAAVRYKSRQDEPAAAPAGAITYENICQLLQLGIHEDAILQRLRKSPTVFVLSAAQLKELQGLGASDGLIAAMRGQRSNDKTTAEITDLAYILDLSNSMNEKTKEGQSKIEVARKIVADLIRKTPDGLFVTFIIYGYDLQSGCKAVKIARPLSELDAAGKEQLAQFIGELKAVGHTPIALALETAGKELAKNNSYCGIVLITDGMETCHGKPDEVAAQLAQNPKLSFGVNIIGFDVQPAERAGVEAIAKAGKGTYYHADSATKFAEVVQTLHKQLETKVAPAPADRATKEFKAAGKDAKPGAFLNDAPLVKPGEYKGILAMMDAHYYQVPVHKGQELRAVGIVQKTPYEVGYSKPYQSFIVTIYDQNFSVAAREKLTVEGNPTTPVTVRATWNVPVDGVAYVAISATDNLDNNGTPHVISVTPKPAPYTLKIKLEGDAADNSPAPLARVETKPGNSLDSAGKLTLQSVAGTDIKLGEVVFYRLPVKKGDSLLVSAAVQKPWYVNAYFATKSTYTLTFYDDDQVQVASKKIEVTQCPPDAFAILLACPPVTLGGNAYFSVACENSGEPPSPKGFQPKPARLAIQVIPQPPAASNVDTKVSP